MSRVEGKKYAQIAELQKAVVNTIENQISIALKKLRTDLKKILSDSLVGFFGFKSFIYQKQRRPTMKEIIQRYP
jgi:hypothetical protein